MPHGPSTPLGRQFRSVLSNLARSSAPSPRLGVDSSRASHVAAQVEVAAQSEDHAEALNWSQTTFSSAAKRKGFIRRLPKRRDDIGRALDVSGSSLLSAARPPPGKIDISFTNIKRIDRPQFVDKDNGRTRARKRGSRLPEILARYIEYTATAEEPAPFRLRSYDAEYLHSRGYGLEDLEVWASALSAPDSLDAAATLEQRVTERGWKAVPFTVHQYLLRRQYIKPAALRVIMRQAQMYLCAENTDGGRRAAETDMMFITFVRLLRHAREVWPQAIEALAEMLLSHLSSTAYTTLTKKTLVLNKAMDLMSLSCAVQPLKDAVHQEKAVVRVLGYMAEHDPPIMLTRPGYRAVVRVQLTQRKTADERQWAELKALSWPPWKVDRTNKDSLITPEHGISRAGHTLIRMREAGFAPQAWEKAAELYAGWDVDGTPSVQVRNAADLDSGHSIDALIWAARIKSTRTAQEAWAAYLAYEDAQQRPSSRVHLAIFEKLFAEECRKRSEDRQRNRSDADESGEPERLLPGDSKEISPLPPSSHLYTYTRTPPPTVEELFTKLKSNGVAIGGHCLGFIVRNAASLQLGFQYLEWGQQSHWQIKSLFSNDTGEDLTGLPDVVFVATIQLLCRYSRISLSRVIPESPLLQAGAVQNPTLGSKTLNPRHTIVRAMELLRVQAPTSPPAYNAVLRALCRDDMHKSVGRMIVTSKREESLSEVEAQLKNNRNTLVLYRMVGRTLSLMEAVSLSLDVPGFHHLCFAVENVALACWSVAKCKHDRDRAHQDGHEARSLDTAVTTEVYTLLDCGTPTSCLKREFGTLVGQSEMRSTTNEMSQLPRLLTTPGPWLLHAYVRALGWMGDHEAICSTIQWMADHHIELAAEMNKHRNATRLMRKVIVAARVFLERSWMTDVHVPPVQPDENVATERTRFYLGRLEGAASRSIADESKRLVESVDEWQGWPSDEEVEGYCRDERFAQIRRLYQ